LKSTRYGTGQTTSFGSVFNSQLIFINCPKLSGATCSGKWKLYTDASSIKDFNKLTRRALDRAHVPPTKLSPRLAVKKTILKPRVAAATSAHPNTYMWDSPDVTKFPVAAHTISEKAIRFRHPDYNPDRAQKLISSSMSRHLSTRNISSKSMHVFLSNLANRRTDRQTDKRTQANAFTCSFVGDKNCNKTTSYLMK